MGRQDLSDVRAAARGAGAAVLLLAGSLGLAAPPDQPITRIADLMALPREETSSARPVHVRAVVTWCGRPGELTIQDDSAGIWVNVIEARKHRIWTTGDALLAQIRVGQELEMEGVSDPGGFAPVILPRSIRILGEKPLPWPRPMVPSRFFSGLDHDLRLEVRGVVQSFQAVDRGWLVLVDANPGIFMAELARSAVSDPEPLVDAEVALRGVNGAMFNQRGEMTMPRVMICRTADVSLERAAPGPFTAPLVALDRLRSFRPESLGPHRVRVEGTVTFAVAGRFCYLQEGNSALRVETRSRLNLEAGDRVEAEGFVTMDRQIGRLVEARVRRKSVARVPAAVAISPPKIMSLNRLATTTGQMASAGDFDGHLIRFSARLLAVEQGKLAGMPMRRLNLETDDMNVGAVLEQGGTAALDGLRPGSELEVTGIVQLEFPPRSDALGQLSPIGLGVLLRSAADVTVLQAPSWWTPLRLLSLAAVIAAGLLAALVWIWELRHQVRHRTRQVATEMRARRDSAVEFQATLRERNRLAANLHDTLLQTLGGMKFQLEACKAEAALLHPQAKPGVHLDVARGMLQHALGEMRESVWALRSLPLHGKTLPEMLTSLVERARAGGETQVELRTEGDLAQISDFVAGNLLLAGQEALHNALKHGHPRTVTLEARPAERPGWILLIVRDDGAGFAPGKQAGPAQGHFGLAGMKERIEKLEGAMDLKSAPGSGTTVRFEVPIRVYDKEVS